MKKLVLLVLIISSFSTFAEMKECYHVSYQAGKGYTFFYHGKGGFNKATANETVDFVLDALLDLKGTSDDLPIDVEINNFDEIERVIIPSKNCD